MTQLTPSSIVTAARLCCWPLAGNDPARPEHTLPGWIALTRTVIRPVSMLVWQAIESPLVTCNFAARFTGPWLHHQGQPNPHSVR